MRKLLALLTLLVLGGGASQAAIINVTNANYRVTTVDLARRAFGADLVQNSGDKKETRTEVRVNKDAKCYRVHKGGGLTPVSRDAFMKFIHSGTRVRVTGGRDWDGKINASNVWAQE